MVTATQVSRLDAKLGAVAAAIDTDNQPITVVVFQGETREFVLQRHRELRPQHAGRLVRFEHRNMPRTAVAEIFAVHTPAELNALLDRIQANGRGKPIGEQMLADAHGSDAYERT
jgi:methylmalonyl-CoA mutase cobalamin-binding subunit